MSTSLNVIEHYKRNIVFAVSDVFSLHLTVEPLFHFLNLWEMINEKCAGKNLVKVKLHDIAR